MADRPFHQHPFSSFCGLDAVLSAQDRRIWIWRRKASTSRSASLIVGLGDDKQTHTLPQKKRQSGCESVRRRNPRREDTMSFSRAAADGFAAEMPFEQRHEKGVAC